MANFTPEYNDIDNTPQRGNYKDLQPFRFWCQKVLPLVYDDSLSYYEVLCKLVDYLNKTMEDVGTLNDDIGDLYAAYDGLTEFVNDNFDNIIEAYNDLQDYVNHYFDNLNVQTEINNKLDAMALDGTLSALVAPYVPAQVTAWLAAHITQETGYVIDDTLTVSGAAADAKAAGDAISSLNDSFKTIVETSENLFTMVGATNVYIDSNGNEVDDAQSMTSDYIPVTSETSYIRPASTAPVGTYYVFYDSSKDFLIRVSANYATTGTTPENASYIRFSAYRTSFTDDFMFVLGDTLPSEYVPNLVIKTNALYGSIDTTLTESGKAADAKAVGDEFKKILINSPNLFNKDTVTDGKYIHSNGTLQPHANSQVSDYIAVTNGTTYTNTDAESLYIGTYYSDKTWKERLTATGTPTRTFDSDVAYIRFSSYNRAFPENFMFCEGESLPTEYYPQKIINPELLVITPEKVSVTKISSTKLNIKTGKGSHDLELQVNDTKNLNTWRLTKGTVNGQTLWSEIDVEGPIKEKDVSDYMTGYHGDEVYTSATFLVDGTVTTIAELDDYTECDSFEAIIVSDVYYDGDTTNKAFVRNKRLVFHNNELEIYNTYKFIGSSGSIDIDIATGTGLYAVADTVVDGYTTDVTNSYTSEATTPINDELERVQFFGDGFVIEASVIMGKTNTYCGAVYYYSDQSRYKLYFFQQYADGSDYLTLTTNQKLNSGYRVKFM